ncbi:vasoactive intestinal polypeptide receptor 2-like [Alosa alosa]|uniref:vasoactive intestinal polypeptide receptor 2-like n=1 Tax=Alosa alosa TaxID=278164 RepID=UPI0020150AB2|nr:vasoactive intestinal polypeptide receptor 2-like [Alosa alosa]
MSSSHSVHLSSRIQTLLPRPNYCRFRESGLNFSARALARETRHQLKRSRTALEEENEPLVIMGTLTATLLVVAALSVLELKREEDACRISLKEERTQDHMTTGGPGCKGFWDRILCWGQAETGQTITIPCPAVLKSLFHRHGFISRNCTAEGWSDVFPNITSVCGAEAPQHKLVFYMVVRILYTLGHSLSLVALTTGSAILCLFRRLHCTRNFIHVNLFLSFMLRAAVVLVKDHVLFTHNTQCSKPGSLVGCKACLVLFHYLIMANFFWLLVEGLYLHSLLMLMTHTRLIYYLLIGWGVPAMFVSAWTFTRAYLEDTGCWERNDHLVPIWVINGPIGFSIMVNFILFISIIRILVQKLRCPDVGGGDHSQYRRLAKSTLLLIPLFGIHYVVFVSLNETMADYKIFFDLAIGSFQGLVVAILYCFLNTEVQGELKRRWRREGYKELALPSTKLEELALPSTKLEELALPSTKLKELS